jgi:hypothetical protein
VITLADYWAAVNQYLPALAPEARDNALFSAIALSPFANDADVAHFTAKYVKTLPYFTVDAEGNPTLVDPTQPPAPAPAPAPPPPGTIQPPPAPVTPITQAPAPITQPPTETFTSGGGTPTTTGECPPGMVPASSLLGGGTQPQPQTIEQQVQSAFTSVAQSSAVFGCKCEPIMAAQQAVNANDFLVVSFWNTASCPTTVTVTARVLDCDCNIQTYTSSAAMAAYTRSGSGAFGQPLTAVICFPLTDGYLISVTVSMTATFVAEAHMWVVAQLKSSGCSGQPSATLIQDYLQYGKTLGWPGGRQLSVGDGPGTSRWRNFSYNGGDGGTDTWNVQGGSLALCRQVYFVLNTSAAAGNRQVWLQYTAPEMPGPLAFSNGQAQPPSSSWGWIFAPGISAGLFNTFWSQTPIPDNLWSSGAGGINLIISGDAAGDSMSTGGVAFQMWAGPPVSF